MAWQWSPGAILTATDLNAVTIPWNAQAQVAMTTPQSITNNSVTILLFDTEDYDARGWHSTVSNTGRITPTIQGWYSFGVSTEWQSDTDFTRVFAEVRKNGASLGVPRRLEAPTFQTPAQHVGATLISLNGSSDYLDATAFQTNTSAGANTCDAVFRIKLEIPF